MNWLFVTIYHSAAMFWETLWALVLGFTISGALQVFVSKEQMARKFGQTNWRSMALATLFGGASSSCSYAAAAAARSAFRQGAALIPALAFMFASTNLVIELGAILWILMGPIFVLAEALGAILLVLLIWLCGKLFFPKDLEKSARAHTENLSEEGCHTHHHGSEHQDRWTEVAFAFVMDWSMLWKEILGGFLIAGFLAVLVPHDWWKSLFLQNGPAWLRLIENAVVGPLIAIASFVCSIGNIPLASLLWSGGISFGGVIAFIYSDLIVIPLILIYRKYYGERAAFFIVSTMFLSIVIAGISVDLLFASLHLIPTGPRPQDAISMARFDWNYPTWLNFAAIAWAGWLIFLYRRSARAAGAHSSAEHLPEHHH